MNQFNECAEKPTNQRQWLWLLLVPSAGILLISCLLLMIPDETWVAMRLQSQGYGIDYDEWFRPTHFHTRHGNVVTNQALVELQRMPQLYLVDFSYTNLSNVDMELLTKIPSLRSLELNIGSSVGSPKGIEKLSECRRLEKLLLLQVPLTSKEIEPLKVCPVKHLYFSSSGLTDADAAVFTLFPQLEFLALTYNSEITDASLDVFETISTLQYLNVRYTGVTEAGIEAFQKKRPDVKLRTDWMDTFGWGP